MLLMLAQASRALSGWAAFAAAAAFIAIVAPAAAAQKAPAASGSNAALLSQALGADDHVSYTGTLTWVIYGHERADATVVRIDHQAPKSWRIWYVTPADAFGRMIV